MRKLFVFVLIAMVVVIGCGDEDGETGNVLGERITPKTKLVVGGELRQVPEVVPGAPALVKPKKTEITYWRDLGLTEELVYGDVIPVGTTVYTKVVFPREVAIVYGDDEKVRPRVRGSYGAESVWYHIKPKSTPDEALESGEAKPWRKTNHIFLCRYDVPENLELVGYYYKTSVDAGREGWVLGKHISLIAPYPNTEPGDFTYVSGDREHSTDLVGQVVVLARDHLDWASNPRSLVQAVPEATVTIVSGPRTGEEVLTDEEGYYRFSTVQGKKLHLRVEKKFLETKEVIVHRSGPTTLPDGFSPARYYQDDPQRHPGVILMGMRWPDIVRPVLEETTVEPDLLLARQVAVRSAPEASGGYAGLYRSGVVLIDEKCRGSIIIHELAHSYQEAMTRKAGKHWTEWEELPEARSYEAARRKDIRNRGRAWFDNGHHASPIENFSKAFAIWWLVHRGLDPYPDEGLTGRAPNRLKWMENHTWK